MLVSLFERSRAPGEFAILVVAHATPVTPGRTFDLPRIGWSAPEHARFEQDADHLGNAMSSAAAHPATHLIGIAPQFLVDDLDRAIAYYCDKLGFVLDFKHQSFYASVSRDGFAIHLKDAPKIRADREHRKENEHLDAHISVTGIQGLYRELEMRGARVIRSLEERPWVCLDFYVEDPDGYILCFSEPKAPSGDYEANERASE